MAWYIPVTCFYRRAFAICLAVMVPLLFLGGPDYLSPRSVALGWQLGHPLFFFMAVALAIDVISARGKRSWAHVMILALGATVLVGGAIEWLQHFVGRQSSWNDVRLDVLGAAFAVGWWGLRQPHVPNRIPRVVLATVGLVILVADLRPLGMALLDEHRMRRAFPVLAAFDSDAEVGRWKSSSPLSLVTAPGAGEARAMRVTLQPAPYSGVNLRYFEGDWRGFSALWIRIFNTENDPVGVTCRINDRQHENDNRHEDRYNGSFVLAPGWSRLTIPLDVVRTAPLGREMDMAQLTGLGCFIPRLDVQRTIIVAGVGLQ
jgi:VanZ family protein